MPSQAININSTSWTAITTAGQDAICWMIKNPTKDRVLIDHSDTGTGALSFGKSYSIALNKEVITDLIADNPSDIFYATCKEQGETAILVIDDYKAVSSTSIIDNVNSSTTPLGANGVFVGDWVESKGFGIIYVSVYSDVASAENGLIIEQATSLLHAHFDDFYTIPADNGKNFSINPHARYYRITYINGPDAQTDFDLQVKLNFTGLASSHRIQDSISTDDDARLVKAVITGETPFGDFVNFSSTRQGNFPVAVNEYGDTPSIDAFVRLRTSSPYTIFDSKQLHDKQPLFYSESIGGSATSVHSSIDANVVMTVTASASDFVIRQTKQRFNYQPGKGQLIIWTSHSPQQTGVTTRSGYFDGTGTNYLTPNNGVFLEITENDVTWNIAKNGTVTESISKADWNYDKFNGLGPSGLTLNTDGLILALADIEWLGAGRCRTGFMIQGLIRYAHYFSHANDPDFTTVYMSTPNLPLRYDIVSDGTGGGTLDHICSTVISEGGIQQTGILRAIDTENVHIDANAADTPYIILAFRLKSDYLDITAKPEFVSMVSETNDDFRWSLHLNPTYNGTLTFSDITNSACQWARGDTTNTVTDQGTKIDAGYAKSDASIDRQIITALTIGSNIDHTRDIIALIGTPLASNADLQGSISFREYL